ncbi:MAG TPA: M6 family metalloprotease domain-containing protein [Fibrobacteraceae bacterium]|nr:M6 family metalloprotease domain-containing protein [Fibrobacteraceae bacterium]
MKKNKIFYVILACSIVVLAKPMPPFPVIRTQTDGSMITVQLKGDERRIYVQSTDGYLLLPDSTGVLYYANNDGSLSAYKAKNVDDRSASETAFLATLDRGGVVSDYLAKTPLKSFDRGSSSASSSVSSVRRKPSISGLTSGEKRIPVILINTNEATFSSDSASWWAQLNEEGYSTNGHIGSVRDYFIDQSSGQFVPTYDIYGPVTISGTLSSLTDTNIISQAMDSLGDEVDFSEYDNDGDDTLDALALVTAGQTADNGGHGIYEWTLGGKLTKDGVKVGTYLFTTELSDLSTSKTKKMDGIGSFTHEFGHVLGLMDLYQTDSSNGVSTTPGFWDVMDMGCYNGWSSDNIVYGTVVPNYSAFERQSLGWLTPADLSASTEVSALPPIDSNFAFTVSTSDDDEWFLLENRQQSGWDAYVPGHGMLIWHIDYSELVWWSNALTNIPSHQYVDIEEADSSDSTAYPYPGTSKITTFSNFIDWNDYDLEIDLYNITESSGNVCFTTDNSVSVTDCVFSSSAQSSSSRASSSSVVSSSSGSVGTVSLTLSKNSNDTVQTVDLGDSIASIIFKTTNGTTITVTGLENTGLSTDTATSSGTLRLTISGVTSGSTGTYHYTVTASADGLNDSSLTGSIAIISSSVAFTQGAYRSQIQLVERHLFVASTAPGTKTLQILDVEGRELQSLSFSGNSADWSLSSVPGNGVLVLRLLSGEKLLERRLVPLM